MNIKNLAMWAIIVLLSVGLFNMFQNPERVNAVKSKIAFSIYGKDGLISNELKYLISVLSSIKSGSNYCVAHTIHGAEKIGLLKDKQAFKKLGIKIYSFL